MAGCAEEVEKEREGRKRRGNRNTPVMVCGLDDMLHSEAFGYVFGLIWPLPETRWTCDPVSM